MMLFITISMSFMLALHIIIAFRKPEQWRTRLVIKGNNCPYHNDISPPAPAVLETKLLINSVISIFVNELNKLILI